MFTARFRIKRVRQHRLQVSFNKRGGLLFQATLLRWESYIDVSSTQLTLDQWIGKSNKFDEPQLTPAVFPRQSSVVNEVKHRKSSYIEIPKTISCIELTMRHDKQGYVVGWMEGEPKTDNWDGSIDNQENIIEKHVSRYGWAF